MELLTMKKRLQVVHLYFSGLSFDQIAAKSGVSKGSITNIINELKAGNFPEAADLVDQIQMLRDLAVDLNKLKIAAGQSAVGIAVLKRIYELGLDPADMERWPLLLNSIKPKMMPRNSLRQHILCAVSSRNRVSVYPPSKTRSINSAIRRKSLRR